ncbi:FIST C-terminal domain-containing protein [Mycolicibacterium poriferae]|uniref:FIST C-terminal domain-containing protein n=1 Tax=Mycolicibacterium poriferae TaxID=39694 RepID=UPI00321AF5A9
MARPVALLRSTWRTLTSMGTALVLLFLFLNARTALWVAAGIPTALLAAAGGMWALGVSINMVSLFGLILTLGRGKEILRTLEAGLGVKSATGAAPDFILGFDCVLRKLEIEQKQLTDDVSEIFRRHKVLGFNTYGEQTCGVHVNQTFVGVAFFEPRKRDLH